MIKVDSRSNIILPKSQPSAENESIVNKIAMQTLGELGVSLALGAVCIAFTAEALIPTIVAGIALQTLVNLVVRVVLGMWESAARGNPNFQPPELFRWIAPTVFGYATGINANIVAHEYGHALSIKALLKGGNPKIELFPYLGGLTSFSIQGATPLAKKIGLRYLRPIISAAGPAFSVGLSTLQMGIGLGLENQAPEAGRMLIVSALINFFFHMQYAFSALWANPADFAHDFVCIWKFAGIHPIASVVMIAALPIFALALHGYFKERTQLKTL